ncbi:MAG: inosine-5-monophosphate dehydrogenase [Candidatus Altiarchaeales archaeon]|nr:MAG: inosine-5-monophosphate dehydrogenase [Candidatus Altiarchaeales archaeon]RLI93897.1 MAG: inosine-5-monophosphate dehydrogenase [Candidatus Altiarchaeales archaeon]HDO81944.1 CBS domain-containing protein [Candidatus Altiarchaeales archaeon]HEX54593.1 CBS domain-containing protein [Candidatus Altiarchaeales archaeon]
MELSVGDAMTRGVIYVRPNENIQRVAEIMKKNDIDSVIVIDNGVGVGIVTDTDIISKIVAEGKDPKRVIVSEIMTSPLITIDPDADIEEAAKVMRDRDIRRLVVTKDGNIVGILSEFDIVRVEPALHLLIREHSQWDIADLSPEVGTISGICEVCDNYSESLRPINGRLICEECASEE